MKFGASKASQLATPSLPSYVYAVPSLYGTQYSTGYCMIATVSSRAAGLEAQQGQAFSLARDASLRTPGGDITHYSTVVASSRRRPQRLSSVINLRSQIVDTYIAVLDGPHMHGDGYWRPSKLGHF